MAITRGSILSYPQFPLRVWGCASQRRESEWPTPPSAHSGNGAANVCTKALQLFWLLTCVHAYAHAHSHIHTWVLAHLYDIKVKS